MPHDEDLRMLRLDKVLELIPVSKGTLYRMIKQGKFPAPGQFGGVSVWSNEEVRDWKDAILENRELPTAVPRLKKNKRDNSDLV